jgi:NAD(P)-dependent dehydrogenase (short-subunit alcohol dehydrogenase family)
MIIVSINPKVAVHRGGLMDLKLHNKKALVTGASAGIGFAIAQALAAEGAIVTINGRSQQRLDEATEKMKKCAAGARISAIACDMGTAAGAHTLLQTLSEVDILINNLGIYEPKEFQEITDEDWMRFFEVNVMSGVRLSRAYLPAMRRNNWGRIIFISSESAVNVPAEMIHYGVTKTAQCALARGIAETTAGTQITVNSVLPGPTSSEGVGDFVRDLAQSKGTDESSVEKEFFEKVRPSSLLKRFATPEEVAAMVVYVASPLSSATNGAALRVDGGCIRSVM